MRRLLLRVVSWCAAVGSTDSFCSTDGWWPGSEAALAHLDSLPCVREGTGDFVAASMQQRVCVGEDITDALGRVVGRAEPTDSCVPAQHAQQWLTTAEGRLVPALQKWFVRGTACAGGSLSSRRVLFFCGGGANNQPAITWSGVPEEARFWATRASWMRGLPPAAAALAGADALAAPPACEEEVHVGVPALCDLLPPPDWLPRYERLIEARPDVVDQSSAGDWTTGVHENIRAKELALTHSLIEASWQADVARGELTQERLEQLVVQLRVEAAVAASVDDSERVCRQRHCLRFLREALRPVRSSPHTFASCSRVQIQSGQIMISRKNCAARLPLVFPLHCLLLIQLLAATGMEKSQRKAV